jgi:esterase/lipase
MPLSMLGYLAELVKNNTGEQIIIICAIAVIGAAFYFLYNEYKRMIAKIDELYDEKNKLQDEKLEMAEEALKVAHEYSEELISLQATTNSTITSIMTAFNLMRGGEHHNGE